MGMVTMPRSQQMEEIQILKFFEEAPLEKAELLFNIVKDKMRSRMGTNPKSTGSQKRKDRHAATESLPKSAETGAA